MKIRNTLGMIGVVAILVASDCTLAALPATDDDFVCDDSFQGIAIEGNVLVPLDAECELQDSVVHGTIQIVQGGVSPLRFATLILRNTEVHGDVKHNASDTVEISDGSVIHGSVVNLFANHPMFVDGCTSVDDSTVHGDLITVRTERMEIDSSFIGGNVKIENSDDRVRISESSIEMTVELNENADIRVTNNLIGGDLLCQNNGDTQIEGNTVGGVVNCNGEIVACPADIAGPAGAKDGVVDVFDLIALINQWGTCSDPENCPADLTGPADDPDGVVDVLDLIELINQWGPCP